MGRLMGVPTSIIGGTGWGGMAALNFGRGGVYTISIGLRGLASFNSTISSKAQENDMRPLNVGTYFGAYFGSFEI